MAGPSYEVYTVVPYGENKSRWTKLGVAFVSRDGKSISVQLDGAPLNGKLLLRAPQPRDGAARSS